MRKILKPIFYNNQQVYSFTYNPCDEYQYHDKGCKRLAMFRTCMYELLIGLHASGIRYGAYIDISEPRDTHADKYTRLHLHGIIAFPTNKAISEWLCFHQNRLSRIGYLNIDTIDDPIHWIQYSSKYTKILRMRPIEGEVDYFNSIKDEYLLWLEDTGNIPERLQSTRFMGLPSVVKYERDEIPAGTFIAEMDGEYNLSHRKSQKPPHYERLLVRGKGKYRPRKHPRNLNLATKPFIKVI